MFLNNLITVLFLVFVGFRFYVLLTNSSTKIFILIRKIISIKLLAPWKIFLISFFIYFFSSYLIDYFINTYLSLDTIDNYQVYMSSNNSSNNNQGVNFSNAINQGINKAGDAAAFAGGLVLGAHIVKATPTLTSKARYSAGGIVLGGAVVVKNLASSVTTPIGSEPNTKPDLKNLWDGSIFDEFSRLNNSDSVLDFLHVLQLINSLQKLFLVFLLYNIVIYTLNVHALVHFISKKFHLSDNNKIVVYANWTINQVKKSGLLIIFLLLILSVCSLFLFAHYFDFLIENFDIICENHLKNINKNK